MADYNLPNDNRDARIYINGRAAQLIDLLEVIENKNLSTVDQVKHLISNMVDNAYNELNGGEHE